ncbi:hypothetical protein PMAYCL1PPCAC_13414 [Pristionchus mayeri]|uniref:Uncharacterized protein n=1 Tax=Pristionchus mayeri TaxID=1317129 RepID=A0AAN5CGK1_9BILA|nr:hypothetical protein PMAYCL1PPCAC_13414 [Pristionchus mayeri]
MEEDDKKRASEIFDRQLELALCSMLPRRIPYTQFKEVDGAMKAMSQTGEWMDKTKAALRDALNRNGFIFHSDLDQNAIAIMNPIKLNVSKIDLRPLKLAASAIVDSLYICRGRAPSAQFVSPCEVVHESFLDGCPQTAVKDSPLADLIYLK